jgi:hypothetical protein
MLKRYTFWLWTAVVFQLLTALFHSISLFVTPEAQSETERQLISLMNTYRIDAGGGFHPTIGNLFTALSSCFSLLCLLGGLTNILLLKKKASPDILKGSVGTHVVVFGACFAMMAFFTFLPPIILTGLIFVSLVISYVLVPVHTGESA